MPSRCWLTLEAPPLSVNNYTPIYIYLSWVCNKRRADSLATESRLGLAQSLLRKRAYPKVLRMQALRGSIQQIADDLLDEAGRDAAERGEEASYRRMDLIEAFAYPFPVTVIGDMLD